MNFLKQEIERTIAETTAALGRPDLFRQPLVGYSSAEDERYAQLKSLIGGWHMCPQELLPGAKSVISCFVPFTRAVVMQPKATKDASPQRAAADAFAPCLPPPRWRLTPPLPRKAAFI